METLLAASVTLNLPDWPTTFVGGATVVLVTAIVTVGYVVSVAIRPAGRAGRRQTSSGRRRH